MIVNSLNDIYTDDKITYQENRFANAKSEFEKIFKTAPTRFFSAPGRTEVGGNHTDHNNGRVLAAAVSLDVIAMVLPADDNIIEIKSEGFPADKIDISQLTPNKNEENSSSALIRGVVAGMAKNGHKIGGFKAYTTSNVLKGSGLSSSAAFEVLVGTILNGLYNDHEVSAVEIAQIAQYAENAFFGKPSGLMDQMASSVGGFITIDFANPQSPVIDTIDFDFAHSNHQLCIVDTHGNHADLTPEYAAVPIEMRKVAEFFGEEYLSEISKDDIFENISQLRKKVGDRAILRALHFMDENKRVDKESNALKNGHFEEFLTLVKDSGNSSYMYLQNVFAPSAPSEQGLSTALYFAKEILDGDGAYRVHGGGFAGTIQAFVPNEKATQFSTEMDTIFGENSCHILSIRPYGGVEIKAEY